MSSLKVKTPPSGESSPEQEQREAEILVAAAAYGDQRGIVGPWTLDDLVEYMHVIHPDKYIPIPKFNQHHEPSGTAEGGRFASVSDSGGEDRRARWDRIMKAYTYERLYTDKHDIVNNSLLFNKYFGRPESRDINAYLRGTNTLSGDTLQEAKVSAGDLSKAFDILAKPLDEDIVVYRGKSKKFFDNIKSGDEITDRGFVSTSLSADWASRFNDDKSMSAQPIAIEIPKRTRILAGKTDSWENEILLHPNSRFSYLGKRKGMDTFRFVWQEGDDTP